MSHWPQCGLLAWKAWAGDLTSSGNTVAQWPSTLPAWARSTHSSYCSAEMLCCSRGDWNGSQPGWRKFASSKTSANDSKSWGEALSCKVLNWMVALKYWQIQTGHWGLSQIFKSVWSVNTGIQTKAQLAKKRPQTVETSNVFPDIFLICKRQAHLAGRATSLLVDPALLSRSYPEGKMSGLPKQRGSQKLCQLPMLPGLYWPISQRDPTHSSGHTQAPSRQMPPLRQKHGGTMDSVVSV